MINIGQTLLWETLGLGNLGALVQFQKQLLGDTATRDGGPKLSSMSVYV